MKKDKLQTASADFNRFIDGWVQMPGKNGKTKYRKTYVCKSMFIEFTIYEKNGEFLCVSAGVSSNKIASCSTNKNIDVAKAMIRAATLKQIRADVDWFADETAHEAKI